MKQITLDGNYYYMTAPTTQIHGKIWNAFLTLKLSGIDKNRFTLPYLLLEQHIVDEKGTLVARYRVMNTARNGSAYGLAPGSVVDYRPMLIPITENGKFDPFIKNNTPNGSIVTGGSIYLNGKSVVPGRISEKRHNKQFTIGDTVLNKELSWIVWDGCLFCCRNLIGNISIEELYKKELLDEYMVNGKLVKDERVMWAGIF